MVTIAPPHVMQCAKTDLFVCRISYFNGVPEEFAWQIVGMFWEIAAAMMCSGPRCSVCHLASQPDPFPKSGFERIVHHRLARGPFGYKPLEGTCKGEDKLEPAENKLLRDTDKSKKISNNIPEKINQTTLDKPMKHHMPHL